MNEPTAAFKGRVPSSDFSKTAMFPRTLRMPTPDEERRGVVVAYAPANFAVYRSVIERLNSLERFRVETRFGVYEMSRADFERTFSAMVRTASYRTGTESKPGRCYYVQGPPPVRASQFLVGC